VLVLSRDEEVGKLSQGPTRTLCHRQPFEQTDTLPQTLLAFTEGTIGLILVALLIAYLPTMYTAFSRREAAVTLLEVRAGSPPSRC